MVTQREDPPWPRLFSVTSACRPTTASSRTTVASRRRVRELEAELAQVRAANEVLMSHVTVGDELLLSLPAEPALT